MKPIGYYTAIISLLFCCEPRPSQSHQNYENADSEAYTKLSMEERRKPENSTLSFQTAEGLDIALFASEPMVVNPTNMDIDERGRIWILESPNYGQ